MIIARRLGEGYDASGGHFYQQGQDFTCKLSWSSRLDRTVTNYCSGVTANARRDFKHLQTQINRCLKALRTGKAITVDGAIGGVTVQAAKVVMSHPETRTRYPSSFDRFLRAPSPEELSIRAKFYGAQLKSLADALEAGRTPISPPTNYPDPRMPPLPQDVVAPPPSSVVVPEPADVPATMPIRKSKAWLWWLLAGGVVVTVAAAVYYRQKRRKR